jgi:hypothetical protein
MGRCSSSFEARKAGGGPSIDRRSGDKFIFASPTRVTALRRIVVVNTPMPMAKLGFCSPAGACPWLRRLFNTPALPDLVR